MTSPEQAANPEAARPGITIQVGSLKLTGASAIAVLSIILVAIGVLVVWARPALSNWPMWVSAALWIGFVAYWSAAARHAAPTSASEAPASRRLHERLLNLALLLLFVPVPGLRAQLLPNSLLVVSIGLLIQTSFIALAIWARRHLGRNWSAAITTKVDHELVRSGPYAVVRHPIYTAMLGMFVGTAIVSGTPHALLAVALIAAVYIRKIRIEERHLQAIFGAQYKAYCDRTSALIPRLL